MLLGSSKKGVLYITDDSLFVYSASGKTVSLIEVFDWEQDDLGGLLTSLIKKNFSSVVAINDTVDQHYRKENVPKVGFIDSNRVIKRRLTTAFPEFPIRTFKKTGKPSNSSDGGVSTYSFLFCACPDNINIVTIINSIRDSGVSFLGFSLLPMESEGLVDEIFRGLSKRDGLFNTKKKNKKDNTGWSIFIGQNASGGLRQIVVKDGGIALTRISPIVETDADMDLWCNDVKRELSSTMGYLSRFGYKSEDDLRIVIIANHSSVNTFDEIMDIEADIDVISLSEAANIIGIKETGSESDHIANILHAGWVASKSKLSFPMKSGMINSVIVPRAQASLVATILVLALVGSMYMFATSLVSLSEHKSNFDVVDSQRNQVRVIYDKEMDRKEALGIDMGLIQNSADIYKKIKVDLINPLDVYRSITNAMNGRIKLDSVIIKKADSDTSNSSYTSEKISGEYPLSEAVLKFSFPGNVDIESGNKAVVEFSDRLKEQFAGAKVSVVKILKDVSYKGEMQSKVGVLETKETPDILEAEIIINMGEEG